MTMTSGNTGLSAPVTCGACRVAYLCKKVQAAPTANALTQVFFSYSYHHVISFHVELGNSCRDSPESALTVHTTFNVMISASQR